MQYVQHDFVGNLAALSKAGEADKARTMLLKEIAQLIIYHRGHAIVALNASGIKTNKFASDKELTDKLAENIGENKQLQGAIASLLVTLNQPVGKSSPVNSHINPHNNPYVNAGGQGAGSVLGGAASGAAQGGVVGTVAGAIGNLFGFLKSNKDAKTQTEQNKALLAQQLLASQPSGSSKTGNYIAIGLVVAAIGAIVYFGFVKKDGSAMPSTTPTV